MFTSLSPTQVYSYLRIPWTEEPGGLQSMKSQRVNMTESNSAQHQFIRQGIIKDKNEQPDKEVQRSGSGKAPSARAPVPMELGCPIPTSQHVDMFTNPGITKPHSLELCI